MLLDYLYEIPDARRGQGKMFELPHLLFFSILAIASGANSYRKIVIFIEENLEVLSKSCGIRWKRKPSYGTIRNAISRMNQKEAEKAFRKWSKESAKFENGKWKTVSLDGKALKHSFDNVADQRFKQMLSAFSSETNLILAHEKIGVSKEKETDAAIKLVKELKLDHVVYTLDALHTQKKR